MGGLLLVWGLACQSVTYEALEVKNRFRIEIPSYLTPQEDMHTDAVLQLGDPYRHTYLLVRYDALPDSNRRQSLEDYYITTVENLLPGALVPYPDSLSLDGLPALRISLDSHHEGNAVRYDLTLVQGKAHLYQILSWVETDEADAFTLDQERMVQSFKEL